MKQFERIKIPTRRIIIISTLSICLSIVIYLLSNLSLNGSLIRTYDMLIIFAFIIGLLTGWMLILYSKLSCRIKELKILKEKASTDNLTELYNRSYLDPYLESEIKAAHKSNQKVSIIMVDMDHFKDINDTYGHGVGDQVLTIFAQAVLKCIRESDIIARYGGDEFIVVLPSTDTETACLIADRIREEVTNTYIPPIDGVNISSISCSIGISTYPEHCDNKSSLIRTSDLALYKAKHSGRNRTIVYQHDFALNN